MKKYFEDKIILITGGTGSIGSEIVRQLIKYAPKAIRVFSRSEHEQFELEQELDTPVNIRYFIGDIRDKTRLERAVSGVDIIFHAAALKHVPSCEFNPFEAVQTNVIGTQNLVNVAIDNEVEKVISISTDKAASPINVMGATKLLSEKIVTSAMYYKGDHRTIFSCVRFGNVLGSRGSVLPLWMKQISNSSTITVTDPNMTRFVMSIPDAVNLVFNALIATKGGEVFILKMPVVRLGDLVEAVVKKYAGTRGRDPKAVSLKIIGIRPGEKMYEVLMTEEEALFAVETEDMFIVLPHARKEEKIVYPGARPVKRAKYDSRSEPLLEKGRIAKLLLD